MSTAPQVIAQRVSPPDDDELLVVVGPTASGKSALAMALCERFDGELVGADSVQIYRHFDIGSGKPSVSDRERVPHHLVDVAEPDDPYDAARYVAVADVAIADIRARGRVPVICGGTFLWVKALLHGLAPSAPKDPTVRVEHDAFVEAHGRPALHARLAAVDPRSAERLAPNDFVRVSRSLEVYETTGKTQTAWHEEHRFDEIRHRARLIGVQHARDELDARIERRTSGWLAGGWLDEVEDLIARGYRHTRAMESVGYRQVRDHLDGQLPRSELDASIVRATRIFVRRQRTWLRDQPVTWLHADA